MPEIKDVNFYNAASAHKLGWLPRWFGCDDYDEDLQKAIAAFQAANKLTVDGMCGPLTYRRKRTEMEAQESLFFSKYPNVGTTTKYIYCDNQPVEIKWNKVVTFKEPKGLIHSPGTYRVPKQSPRQVKNFVVHWDECLSSKKCYDILEKRHLSVQFSIDNDGTIYQFLDTDMIAQQAGKNEFGSWNNESIGVEVTNAVFLKYQNYYKTVHGGERPIWQKVKVHKEFLGNILGFYPWQEAALAALMKAVCDHYNIPLECPIDENGKLVKTVYDPLIHHIWSGVCFHYHLTDDKIDAAGCDLIRILNEAKAL